MNVQGQYFYVEPTTVSHQPRGRLVTKALLTSARPEAAGQLASGAQVLLALLAVQSTHRRTPLVNGLDRGTLVAHNEHVVKVAHS